MWTENSFEATLFNSICFLSPASQIRKSPGRTVKVFVTLFKLNITFYFKCYLHHNCSVNLNWNNTQLCSFTEPLRNVLSSVFWFAIFCFLPFLRRTTVQKWKKNCYVMYTSYSKWNVGKDIKVPVSKPVHRSCSRNQSFVQRSRNPPNFEKVYYFFFKFLDSQQYSYITV